MHHSFNSQPGFSLSRRFRLKAIGQFFAACCLLLASSAWAVPTFTTDIAGNNLTGVPYDLGQTYIFVVAPTVTSLTPTSGPTAGNTAVTITGTSFTGATAVTIGGTAATGITVVNDTTITCTTPAGSAGSASVLVTTPGGTNSANTLYTYTAAPTVTSISPTSGSTAGNTAVTITGTNFTGTTAVTIGGAAATSVVVVNATTITCNTPAGSLGTASVLVTTPAGTNAANTLYTYAVPADMPATISGGVLTLDGSNSANPANTTLSINGLYLEIYDPSRTIGAGPGMIQDDSHTIRVLLTSITSLVINGTPEADTFTLDYGNVGTSNFPANITVNGGLPNTAPGDTLAFQGTGTIDGTYDTSSMGSGSIDLSDAGYSGTVNFTGMEPIDFTGMALNNFTVNVDNAGVFANANLITNVASSDAGVNTIVSFLLPPFSAPTASGLEYVKFGTVNGSLTVNGASTDNNYFQLVSLGTQMLGDFTVASTGLGADVIEINNTTFTVPGLNKNLSLTASFIGIGRLNVAPGSDQPGVISCSGNITLVANGDSSVTQPLWDTTAPVVSGVWGTQPTYFIGGAAPALNVEILRGTIQVRGNISKTAGNDATLTMQARGTITFPSTTAAPSTGQVTSTTNKLNVVLQSDTDSTNAGSVLLMSRSQITTNGGYLTIGGGANPATSPAMGTVGQSTSAAGVTLQSATLTTSGGNISILGQGANSQGSGEGVSTSVFAGTVDTLIDSGTGTLSMTGTGGTGTSSSLGGVVLVGQSTLAVRIHSSTGNITINGTDVGTGGGFSSGVHLGTNSEIISTGAANISITGSSAATYTTSIADINVAPASSTSATVSTVAGNVTFIGDTMNLAGSTGTKTFSTSGSGRFTVKQRTPGKNIDLGATDTTSLLGLSTTELGTITATTLQIGDASSGTINVSAALAPTTFTTLAFANNTTFAATGGFTSTVSSATNYTNMTVTGTVSINNPTVSINPSATLALNASGGYIWNGTDSFTILSNTDTDAISGTFSGPTLTNFLGSAYTASQSYAGGTGNDLVFGTAPTVTSSTSAVMLNATTIVITGTGFSTTPANNTVVFNDGTVGHVTSATATSLTVALDTPPASTGSLTAVVTTNGLSSGSAVQVATVTTYALATTALLEGPAAGTDSVVLTVTPETSTWSATANAAWLHTSASGTGSANVVFTFDANAGATRSGTLTIAGQTLTVTQAGSTYVAANPVTALVSTGLSAPNGVAVDGSGNVYIADSANNAIKKWTAATNTVSTLVSSGLNSPTGVAVDGGGNVYIADFNNNAIKKWTAATSTVSTLIATGLNTNPFSVAVDASGNVYFNDQGHNAIKKWTAATSTVSTLVASGLNSPTGVALDGSGNVYIADSYNSAIKQWTAATQTVSALVSSGLNHPFGVAVDGSGNVYIADSYNSAVKELPRAFVDPTAFNEAFAAGADALPVVLPATENLLAPFAPTSDSGWLTLGSISGGVVNFNFTANTGAARTAHISLLGQSIAVNQAAVPAPTVTSLSPTSGSTAGGTVVTITGTHFTAATAVSFGGTPAASYSVTNDTTISATTPTGAVGTASVLVTNGGGTNAANSLYTYVAPPTVTLVTTSLAVNAGTVTITGTGFSSTPANNTVTFNHGAVGTVSTATTTSLTVTLTTPPTSLGSLTAIVTNTSTSLSSGSAVQVATVIPVITPSSANLAANASGISISGFGFDSNKLNDGVTFSGAGTGPGTVTAASSTGLGVNLPSPLIAGVLNATMTSDGVSSGTAVQVATITPVVSNFNTAVAANATTVTIHGAGFDSTTPANNLVTFNNGATGTVTSATSTSLTVTFGTNPTTAGTLTAVVTTNTVSSGAAIPVAAVTPVVTSSTASIQTTDSTVTINGFGLASSTGVTFNLGATGTVTSSTPTQIVVTFGTKPTVGALNAVVYSGAQSSGSAVQVATVSTLSITSSTTNLVQSSTTLTIAGTGFSTTAGNNTVTFNNGAVGHVTSSTTTSLSVTFDTLATSLGALNATVTVTAVGSTGPTQVATVVAGAASKLVVISQPTNTVSGAVISPAVTVQIQDANGFLTTSTANVTLSLNGIGTLSGTKTVAAVAGVATFNNLSVDKAATGYTLSATSAGLTPINSNTFNITAGAAAKLAVITQPTNTVSATVISPAVTVQIQDAAGNVTTSTANVVMAIGTNPSSGTLSGTTTVAAVAGVATFSTLQIDKAGTGYTLGASSGVLTGATSGTFNITAGAPAKLAVTAQPTNTVSATAISPAVTVQIQDAAGNLTTSNANVVMAIGTNPSSGTLSGTTTVAAVSGTATFSTLQIDKAGVGYTLSATSGVLTSSTSNTFNITAGAAAKLAVITQPTNTVSATAISPSVVVQIQDAAGNLTTSTASVVMTIGTNPGSGSLSGTTTVPAVAGSATFTTLKIDKAGTGYTLSASSGVLTSATSNTFNITAGVPAKLAVTTQPTNTVSATAISPSVVVQIQDAAGNLTTSTANVVMAIGTNPGSGTLSGTTTVAAVAGSATFSTLNIDKAGTSYTLSATSGVLTSATSNTFNITAGAAAKLAVITQPTNTVAGVAISPAVTVQIQDAAGNLTTSTAGVVMAIGTNPGGGTLSGTTTVNAVAGTATFSTLSIDKVGTGYTLGATSGVLTAASSGTFNITPAAVSSLALSAPGTATAGTAVSLAVTAKDAFGNTATGYSGTVHFTTSDASAVLPANSTLTSGTGNFSVTFKTAGTQTVTGTDTVTSSITGTTGNVVVSAAAATHFTVAVAGSATAGVAFSGSVTALDQFNNIATGYTGTIHWTTSDSGASTALPANYTFVSADSGVHIFTNSFTLVTAGTQTVTATDTVTGSIIGTSANITVSAAAASQLIVTAPGTATAGVAINTSVTAKDQYGNTAVSYLGTVHFTKTDSGIASALPANYTFVGGDNGVHIFTNGVTLVTVGNQTVTATDTVTGSINGTSGTIAVGAAAASTLTVTAPTSTTAGVLFSSTVTALDQFGNTATGYRGIVHFTKTDGGALASVPVNYTFTSGDSGVHTFSSGVKLVTAGSQTLTATDTVTNSITGTTATITVNAAAASYLAVSAAGTATAGVAINSSVTALDPYGNTAVTYTGTVHFTASDVGASVVLPANYTFLPGDNGVHVFTGALTFVTAGSQTLTATDTISGSITGTSTGTVVSAAAATHLAVTAPGTATAGVAVAATVTAQDQYGNTATSYLGIVNFTKTDVGTGSAVPVSYPFVVGDNGTHTFTGGVTLVTAGSQTVTATDTVTGTITGTSGGIAVSPAATSHFVVTAPTTAGPGTPITVTLTAEDAFNNVTPAYIGTVAFTLSDTAGGTAVPANYTFLVGDAGIHTFTSGVTFATPGVQTVTATDTVSSTVKGLATVNVGTLNPTPIQLVPTDPVTGQPLPPGSLYPVISQSGTIEVRVSIKNTTAFPINGFRLSVDYSAYLPFHSLVLYNRTSPSNYSEPANIDYIDYPYPVAVNASVSLKLQFYTTTRTLPNPFSPTLTVTTLATSEVSSTDGSGVQPRIHLLPPNNNILLEWDSTAGQWYRIKYSSDLVNWFDCPVPVQGVANRTQWVDDGPPFTNVPPASVGARYYKLNTIAPPTGP